MRLSIALLVVSCAGCGAAPPPTRTVRTSPVVLPSARSVPTEPALDARISRTVAGIGEPALRADVAVIAEPRNAVTAPAHLARVADYIASELAEAGLHVSRQPVDFGGASADNVIGERPGTDPTRVVVIAAHYDAVPGTPGADDDASGVAAILAVARALGPMRTGAALRVIAFAFEEDGLVGSQAYVASLPRGEDQRIVAVLSLDMVGYRATGAGTQRYPEGAAELVALATGHRAPTEGTFLGWMGLDDLAPRDVASLREAARYVPALPVTDLVLPRAVIAQAPDLVRGDHASFWARGYRAIGVTDTGDFRNPNYHLPSDTAATLDFAFATDAARWLAAATLLLAGPP